MSNLNANLYAIADELKAAVAVNGENDPPVQHHQPVEEWYIDNAAHKNTVLYRDIAENSEKEYTRWVKIDSRIGWTATMRDNLVKWLTDVSREELVRRLAQIPAGVTAGLGGAEAFRFTKFQLASLMTWVDLPFDASASITIETPTLRIIADYAATEIKRARPIKSSFAILKGSVPDVTLVDFPTATGKTAWALAATALLLSPDRWPKLLAECCGKRSGTIFRGTCDMNVARMVVVATAAATFDHFRETLRRSIPEWKRKWPTLTYVVWDTYSKYNSVQTASELPEGTVVFWIIPISKTNEVLRAYPDVVVSALISDEFTVDTPREKGMTAHSWVVKTLITQATPQALVAATRGNRSFLKTAMGGVLHSPRSIVSLVANRSFSEAQLACDQACKLSLMSLTAYRSYLRDDLQAMIPPAMDIHFVRCKVVTFGALLTNSQVDMVPADFGNILLSYLSHLHLTDVSIVSLRDTVSSGSFSPSVLVTCIQGLQSKNNNVTIPNHPSVTRLVNRLHEFSVSCPICLEADQSGFVILGCCGYVTCQACGERLTLCPFCRKTIPTRLPRRNVPQPSTPQIIDISGDGDTQETSTVDPNDFLPRAPPFVPGRTFDEDLAQFTNPRKIQSHNLFNVLHVLMRHGYKRPVIVIERSRHESSWTTLENIIDTNAIWRLTGYTVHRIDGQLRGKGYPFSKMKREFDSPLNPPTALLCYGIDASFMVGTDLAHADCLVVVGAISADLITQAMGRIFRPLANRDNTRAIKVVKVYSGDHPLRRRPRPAHEDEDN